MTFYDWRARHGLQCVGNIRAGSPQSSAGPDDGIELVDMEKVHIDNDNAAPPQAGQQQQPQELVLEASGPSAGLSSAATVVASSSAPTVAGYYETPNPPRSSDEVRVDDANIPAATEGQQAPIVGQ